MSTEDQSVAFRYKLLKQWIQMQYGLQALTAAYSARLQRLLAPAELDIALDLGIFRILEPPEPIEDDYRLNVLACPWGKDTTGCHFSAATNFHPDFVPVPAVLHNHGLDTADKVIGQRGSIIGQVLSRDVRADGLWYEVALDRGNAWARAAWDAAKIGRCRGSTGTVTVLQHTEPDGWFSDWPVVEVSLFESTGKDRRPRHPYAVAVPASVTLPATKEGAPPAAFLWAIDRSIRCDAELSTIAGQLQQFAEKG